MKTFKLIAPCHFGMEAVLKREIYDLGYEILSVEDGRVSFAGDPEAVVRANIFLRTAERVLIQLGSFPAKTYDELFEGVKALPLEEFFPKEAEFPVVKASSVKSALYSPSDIQSIVKKAAVERLKSTYHLTWFPENGARYPIRVFLHKDMAEISLDTTGESLHKRGYRKLTAPAPISENLAAAILMLTPWKKDRVLVDPFCGSGTFLIEAALMAAGIAPGKTRSFLSESHKNLIPEKLWEEIREEAAENEDLTVHTELQGYDIDGSALEMARKNAALAGVSQLIHFQKRDVKELSHAGKYGFLVTNPPYGERLADDHLYELYHTLGERYQALDSWSMYLITAYEQAEKALGLTASKNRKLYNGMIKTYLYQFAGPKPPKRREH